MSMRFSLLVIIAGALAISGSIGSVTTAQDSTTSDPLVDALGGTSSSSPATDGQSTAGKKLETTTVRSTTTTTDGQNAPGGANPFVIAGQRGPTNLFVAQGQSDADEPVAGGTENVFFLDENTASTSNLWIYDGQNGAQPLPGNLNWQVGADGTSNLWITDSFGRNSQTVELTATSDNGNLTVTLNGQRVPGERLDRSGDVVTVKDAEGRTVATISLSSDGRVMIPRGWTFRGPAEWLGETSERKVIGIRTGNIDSALSDHLGLASGEGILISSVVSGQPAERVGLKSHDVIVALNGQRPASLPALKRTLAGTADDGKVRLTIVRAGQTFEAECGVASVSTPNGGSASLPAGSYTFGSAGGNPTSLYWHRQSQGSGTTTSAQGTASFPPGVTPLPGGLYGSRGNVVVDRQGRPLEPRSATPDSPGPMILGGQILPGGTGTRGGGRVITSDGSDRDIRIFDGSGITLPRTTGTKTKRTAVLPDGYVEFPRVDTSVFEDRTEEIENRLERLEKLLEKLLEQKERNPRASVEPESTEELADPLRDKSREQAAISSFFEVLYAPF